MSDHKLCKHCQQPIPDDNLLNNDFCCYGCQSAYKIINDLNLNNYYNTRKLDINLDAIRPDEYIQPLIIDDNMITMISDNEYNLSFSIENLHCAACIWLIEQVLGQIDGIINARINLSNKILNIYWDPNIIDIHEIIKKINQLGYKLYPYVQSKLDKQNKQYEYKLIQSIALLAFATANIMLFSVSEWSGIYLGISLGYLISFHWLSFAISLPIILYTGRIFYIPAFKSIFTKQMGMDIPVTVAIIATIGLSIYNSLLHKSYIYFDASVILLFFLTVGRYLEHRTKSKSTSIINNLSRLQEQDVISIDENGQQHKKPASSVQIGENILIHKESEILVDGIITNGHSHVNQAVLNGESIPQHLHINDNVYAGTFNISDTITVKTTVNSANTVLAKLISMAQSNATQNTKFITFAQKVIKIYIPTIHLIALLTGIWVLFTSNYDVPESITRAVTVLLVTCPCALALAVPLMNTISNNLLFENNIIIQGSDTLDKVEQSKHIFLDKTGTLTEGNPQVTAVSNNKQYLDTIALITLSSNHPYSKAIASYFGLNKEYLIDHNINLEQFNINEEIGYGLQAQDSENKYYLGSTKLIQKILNTDNLSEYLNDDDKNILQSAENDSIIWYLIHNISNNTNTLGFFACNDTIKDNISNIINQLHNLGYQTTILSGDNKNSVRNVAEKLNIDSYYAELNPMQKVELIQKSVANNEYPIMIGDGINDTGAMNQATVSISPSNAMHLTKTHADILLRTKSLNPILKLIYIARQTQKRIKMNIYISLFYNLISIPIAIFGYLNPLIAAVLMSSSSIIVTINSIRKMD